jgi:hypothetical protein
MVAIVDRLSTINKLPTPVWVRERCGQAMLGEPSYGILLPVGNGTVFRVYYISHALRDLNAR